MTYQSTQRVKGLHLRVWLSLLPTLQSHLSGDSVQVSLSLRCQLAAAMEEPQPVSAQAAQDPCQPPKCHRGSSLSHSNKLGAGVGAPRELTGCRLCKHKIEIKSPEKSIGKS